MRTLSRFLRATILGGVLFLAPIAVVAFVLSKALDLARAWLMPVAKLLPDAWISGPTAATALGVAALAIICFVAGLFADTRVAQAIVKELESKVLSKVPAYEYLKEAGASVMGLEQGAEHPVVMARIGDSWRIGVRTDADAGGLAAVFLPNSPNSFSGSVFFVTPDRIRKIDVPLAAALGCLRRCGVDAGRLLQGRFAVEP
jgi:uncharacterized membrane protein